MGRVEILKSYSYRIRGGSSPLIPPADLLAGQFRIIIKQPEVIDVECFSTSSPSSFESCSKIIYPPDFSDVFSDTFNYFPTNANVIIDLAVPNPAIVFSNPGCTGTAFAVTQCRVFLDRASNSLHSVIHSRSNNVSAGGTSFLTSGSLSLSASSVKVANSIIGQRPDYCNYTNGGRLLVMRGPLTSQEQIDFYNDN